MASLDTDAIKALMALPEAWDVRMVESCESTNDAVLTLPKTTNGAVGSVLFTERQLAGRGRRGNVWFSGPPESNLIFSCRVSPPWPLPQWVRLTHLTTLALTRALDGYPPALPLVKWPNDIYLGKRKLSGILTETHVRGAGEAVAVIGLGVNVNVLHEEIPEEIPPMATSLREVTGTWIDREALAARVLDALAEILMANPEQFLEFLAELRAAHYLLGKEVRARTCNGLLEGKAVDLGPEGELILQLADGAHLTVSSADEVRLLD